MTAQFNTSLAAPGALPHGLQRCTKFKSKMAARWPQNSWLGLQKGLLRGNLKKKHSTFKDIVQIEVDPPPSYPNFYKFIIDIVLIMLTSPPPLEFFDKIVKI